MNTLKYHPLTNQLKNHFKMSTHRQILLFPEISDEIETPKPVNVASVPQRSPFRYPGGKTWFVPTFRKWFSYMKIKPHILVEPFAGGGIISLTALFENLVEKAVMVELDDEIASVWESIVNGEAKWLSNRILSFNMTKKNLLHELKIKSKSKREKAFQTILKNRTLHGGILAEGSRFIKSGENGKGISSRWYPGTLSKRLLDINHIVNRIDFRCENGLNVLKEFRANKNAIFFIDPPYTAGGKKAGKRLYKHYELDHENLFQICESLKGDFLITYDNADEVKELACQHKFQLRLIPMKNTHHRIMKELVIGKDLSWMDNIPGVHQL